MKIKLLSIDLSNHCSKQCPFCYNGSKKEGSTLWTIDEITRFASDCIRNGVEAVSLGGGEPFEYDGIFDIIDALIPKAYVSVTSNGLPLGRDISWNDLKKHRPDKIHISLHNPDNPAELSSVISKIMEIERIGIKAGCNLLVSASNIEESRYAYKKLSAYLTSDRIIIIPKRFSDTPTPKDLAYITDRKPFQSPSCILKCDIPKEFASVTWDKKVNFCSYALLKEPLESLDFKGLINALKKVNFKSCLDYEDFK